MVLVPPAKTPEEALAIVRHYAGQAIVRVGIAQYPAGIGSLHEAAASSFFFEPPTFRRQASHGSLRHPPLAVPASGACRSFQFVRALYQTQGFAPATDSVPRLTSRSGRRF